MKAILLSLFSLFMLVAASEVKAQDKTTKTPETKEEKAAKKQKQAEELEAALTEAGITGDEATKFKDILKEYGGKSSAVKKNTALTEAEKEQQLDAIKEEKNQKLQELVGAEKYRAYNGAKKKQSR
jgi:hypothetical protein